MKNTNIEISEGTKLLSKRQRGMMKCIICGKKLKRFPSNKIYSKIINDVLHMTLITEYTGYNLIDRHLKCVEKLK